MKRVFFLALIIGFHGGYSQEKKTKIGTIDQREWISELLVLSEENIYSAPSKALSYAEEAFKIAEVLEDRPLQAKILNRIGISYWSLGDLDISMTYLNKSMDLANSIGDYDLAARNLGNLGNVFSAADLNASAINLFKEALVIFEQQKNENRIFVFNHNIATAFLNGNELDSAEKYFINARRVIRDNEEFAPFLPIFNFNIAELAFKQGNYRKTDSLLMLSMRFALEQNDLRAICRNKQLKAEIQLLKNEQEKALILASESYQIAKKSQVKELISVTSKTLSRVFAANKNYEQSYFYMEMSETYSDSLQSTVIKRQLMVLKNQQERRELEILKAKAVFAQERTELSKTLIIGLILVLMIVSLLFYLLWRSRKKLSNKNHQVEDLSDFKSKILTVISNDLRSPASALYDTITAIENTHDNSGALDNVIPTIKRKTKEALDLMDSLIVWAKAPNEGVVIHKTKIQVRPLINELVESFQYKIEDKKLTIDIEVEEDESIITDPNLFRVVIRTFLSNAVKYSSEGGAITVFSLMMYGKYKLIVKDEGVGLSSEQIELLFSDDQIQTRGTKEESGSGIGLRICKSFADMLDGKINVRSDPGMGADFSLVIPI